ncbi:response regulator transcription factor [uncultured Megasphaera sp.]|uniref:response regulator transcription factor n=1 Tax=uncultured Megasphaera sp. TaxID=165188 RepID=UPI0026594568|nr:response regulator transcription factor [uncultured Megasphaera sp.]
MKLLLAEDEKAMSMALAAILEHSGYTVDAVYDGAEALEKGRTGAYDCMIFDIMMPKMDGVAVLKELRSSGDTTPVIMLTAKAEIDDRITGLDAGADDYLTKPFAMGELLARIRSMTRRSGETFTPDTLTAGSVRLDLEEQELSCKNAVRLGNKEAKLMKYFMLNPGKCLSADMIFSHIWKDDDDVTVDIVWMYVSYLREKLQAVQADIAISGNREQGFSLIVQS